MISNLFESLAWLPRPPADFKQRLGEAMALDAPGPALRALATHALDAANLRRLSAAVAPSRRAAPRSPRWRPSGWACWATAPSI